MSTPLEWEGWRTVNVTIVAVCALILFAVCGIIYVARRNRPGAPEAPVAPPTPGNTEERRLRQQRIDLQGTELLARRVVLDGRRGTLGGDSDLLDAMSTLEERYHRGDITEDEFEAEKIRLLGG